ncbi:MAG: transcription-repair coupling factor [Planctomycetota bacterium]|nr:MAG: transcription-repair coupling factor [Planctomycetota bacterium]
MKTITYPQPQTLRQIPDALADHSGFSEVVAALRAGRSGVIEGTWGSAAAAAVAALTREGWPWLIVLPRVADVEAFAQDLSEFTGTEPLVFPAWDLLPTTTEGDAVFGQRLRVLRALSDTCEAACVVAPIAALLAPVPSPEAVAAASRTIRVGQTLPMHDFLHWLEERRLERVPGVALPGEFAVRGGIVDVFPPGADAPVRMEWFDDEVESIREFDVETQRTTARRDAVTLTVFAEATAAVRTPEPRGGRSRFPLPGGASLLQWLPSETRVAICELTDVVSEGKQYLQRLDDPIGLFSVGAVLEQLSARPSVTLAPIAPDSVETTCRLQVAQLERLVGPRHFALQELARTLDRDERVLLVCHNTGEQQRLAELIGEPELKLADRVRLCVGTISRGFRLISRRLLVISDHELFGRNEAVRARQRRQSSIRGRAIDSFLELNEGDYVVHVAHGIARYRGLKLMDRDGHREEHLVLEFRDGVLAYVPISSIDLVQKYVGSKAQPTLSKYGGTQWSRKKEHVARAVTDLAADMIRMQAVRHAGSGTAFPPDSRWQQEFEAAFPFEVTPDQQEAIQACKQDLQQPRPMDRLICGDVGFGKTEVALRAAFKVVDAGYQVAVLVPTTVLAEQHYRTFSERMAEFPIEIASLSRLKSRGEQQQILERLADGSIDIVIGTHRLIQPDVRFRKLGLLIIDEEQRFGVEAKEALKRLRTEVDVLTLSATPIPRTLHMALLGIRDISSLQTPPRDRLAIATYVCRFDEDLIRHAIIRELNRGGQVYFVHNRVYNIEDIARTLRGIVPEATIDVAHGQMRPHELESAMLRFIGGRTDVLVCTTIIESGVDIPNANTMFIHCADQFGLADLHQLRGRVGRYRHRAYCYLLLEKDRPVTPTAARRLRAIEEFSELGAGFKIAMRDLEIRGAGNLLGTEQSGHIAAVGYELYCQLLENAVRRLLRKPPRDFFRVQVDLPLQTFIPDAYIPVPKHKLEIYRKLSQVTALAQLAELRDELQDRYGPPPPPVDELLTFKHIQLLGRHWRIARIAREDAYLAFTYRDPGKMSELRKRCGSRLRIADHQTAYLVLPGADSPISEVVDELKSVLRIG